MIVRDTGWRQAQASKIGDMERIMWIPSPDPDESEMKIRFVVFQCEDATPERRWRGHCSLDNHELFRLFSPTLEGAQTELRQGLSSMGKCFTALDVPNPG
jgi:hypothetical protein